MAAPKGLESGGRALWLAVSKAHDLDGARLAVLEQACRQRDRADQLAAAAASGDASALRHERDSGLAMARLLACLRLPDQAGRRPQARQLRGVHKPAMSARERLIAAG